MPRARPLPLGERETLKRFVWRAVERLARPGDSVAITGSVARGNARADSDLDLWVLGERSGRFVHRFEGVSVTLLCQRPAEAMTRENLCLYEVDDLLVLRDASGAFSRLQARWRRDREVIRAKIRNATLKQLAWEKSRAEAGSPAHRVAFLRLVLWRRACLGLFERTGWRVPRLHLLFERLPPPAARLLRAGLALPSPAQARRALALLPRAVRELRAPGYQLPDAIFDKAALAPIEAAFLARRELIFELIPRAFAPYGVTDLRGLELFESRLPSLVKGYRLLEPGGTMATVRRLERQVAALERALR